MSWAANAVVISSAKIIDNSNREFEFQNFFISNHYALKFMFMYPSLRLECRIVATSITTFSQKLLSFAKIVLWTFFSLVRRWLTDLFAKSFRVLEASKELQMALILFLSSTTFVTTAICHLDHFKPYTFCHSSCFINHGNIRCKQNLTSPYTFRHRMTPQGGVAPMHIWF